MQLSRKEIGDLIFKRIFEKKDELKTFYKEKKSTIGYFFLDDLLPDELVTCIYDSFPEVEVTKQKKSIREFKYVAYQMNTYNALLEEVVYAFQEEKIVRLISDICGLDKVYADENLYAGGLSLMKKNNYLNPHLDNSHDKDRDKWRVLNLLYYVTPNWKLENGGNLELWEQGLKSKPVVIESRFNRLVVMATHQNSWHSVSKINVDAVRCCVSNYYFSDISYLESDTFHVTTFRGRPEERFKNVFLKIDSNLRSFLRKFFTKGIRKNPHQYRKK